MSKNIRITALLALTIAPLPALAAPIQAILYKNPQCTCCEMYADYLRANGFDVQLKPTNDLEEISAKGGRRPISKAAIRCLSTATPLTGLCRSISSRRS